MFLVERLIEEEDVIVIECTELFDWQAWVELLTLVYHIHVFKVSPHHMGIPVTRLRWYMVFF